MIKSIGKDVCRPAAGRRFTIRVAVVSLVATLGVAVASPARAEPPPTKLPLRASQTAKDFQPAMDYDTDGCYPSVAIDKDKNLNPGLNPSGALNGACRDESDLTNSNTYTRSRCNSSGWCAHMYDFYFQKDQETAGATSGHRHDWEHIMVWTLNDVVQYVGASQHGDYVTIPAADVVFLDDAKKHPKIVYHKDGPSTHAFRFANADEDPENHWDLWHFPDLVGWNGYPSTDVRDALMEADFGSASIGIKEDSFVSNLESAHLYVIVEGESIGWADLPFEFDFENDSLPPGMPDPNAVPDDGDGDGDGGDDGGGGGAGGQQIAVASYIHPNATDGQGNVWDRLNASPSSKVSVVVANVLNGPDSQVNTDWQRVINAAAGSGKRVLGYVPTGYLGLSTQHFPTRLGSPDLADWIAQIEQDVNKWHELYGDSIGGIFFDEGFNECGAGDQYAEIYRHLNQYVKNKFPDSMTVLNPGTIVPQCYEDTADVLMTFESDYLSYYQSNANAALNYKPLDWTPADPHKIWHIVYGVPADHVAEVTQTARDRNAGYIQVTDDTLDNPYDTLPAPNYWSTEVSSVGTGTPAVASPDGGTGGTPQAPSGLAVLDPSFQLDYTSVKLTWAPSTGGAYRYRVYVDGKHVVSVPGSMNIVTVGSLDPGKTHQVYVTAESSTWGDESAPSNTVPGTTLALPHGIPIENVQATLSATSVTYAADFLMPYAFRRLYVLRDPTDTTTPCYWTLYGDGRFVCSVYMLENNRFFAYTGPATGDVWSWRMITADANPVINKYNYRWTLPLGDGASPRAARDHFMVQGEGYGPFRNVVPAIVTPVLP